MNISSFNVRPGDVISVCENNRSVQLATRAVDLTSSRPVMDWLSFDKDKLTGVLNRVPEADEIDTMVNVRLVVELYSR